MGEEYYILENGEKKGPFTFKELINEGIDLDTQILAPTSTEWQSASYLPQFADYFISQGYLFPTEDNLAAPGYRTLAFFIDYMVLSIVAGMIMLQTGLLKNLNTTEKLTPESLVAGLGTRTILLIELAFVIIFLIYNVIFETSGMRGSLGKRICGLKVVDADGDGLSLVKAILRNIGAVTVYAFFPFGALIIIISFFVGKHRQTWYERYTASFVIKP